jgi:predicted lipoprotein with Yx(FWY)xxD motif
MCESLTRSRNVMVAVPEISTRRVGWGRFAGRTKLASLLAGVALAAASCGSSGTATTTSGPTTSTVTPGGGGATSVAVKIATVGTAGRVLVDSKGLTLYKYALDKPGKIACVSSTCVGTWPPLLVPSGDQLATMSGLSTEKRPNGDVQVTYKGSPLYTFSGDSKAGQDNGVGIPDWSVASVASSTGSSTTTSSTSSGGYGY